ncbi:MAG: PDZ domain-containing protein [Gemmatimonadota bacterium]|nr:PDZ domain-containing protein [Gemmatimonadales bacterium]MDQ3138914.1 PDZ domain-containing protein [Gemmatimonadota bacterium]
MRFPLVLAVALTAAGLPVAAAGPLDAQEGGDSARPERPGRPDRRMDEPDRIMRIVMNRRARLGIKVNLQARGTDSLGAYVESVSPNGPAAKAGIRSGDLITKVDGKSVMAGGRAEADADERQSLPGLRLIELAARLEPADTVSVEFLRGRDRRTVSVVTEDEPDALADGAVRRMPFAMRFRPGEMSHRPMRAGDFMDLGPGERFEFLAGSPLGDLELAPLNPDLGQYFGATAGVLVIRAPKEGPLGLKGGDVVQAVDGRKPSGPAHLMRILRSYDRGETFKLDILRNRKRETVAARLGERDR